MGKCLNTEHSHYRELRTVPSVSSGVQSRDKLIVEDFLEFCDLPDNDDDDDRSSKSNKTPQ